MYTYSFLLLPAIVIAATLLGGCGFMLFRTNWRVVLALGVWITCCLTAGMIFAPVGGISKPLLSAETSEMESARLEALVRELRIKKASKEWNIHLQKLSLEQVPPRYIVWVRFECNKVSIWNRSRIVKESEYIERCLATEWTNILQDGSG